MMLMLAGPIANAQKSENGLPETAFLFEARLQLAGNFAVLGIGFGNALTSTAFTAVPSLLLGARLLDRIQVGLGIGLIRAQGNTGGGTQSFNFVTFAPTIAGDIVKSADNRVAFYAKLGIPLGPVITTQPMQANDNNFAVGFDIALGARYAVHRQIALGFEAGFGGTFVGPQRDNTTGTVAVYGGLVGSFYSGH
jgi:hypothetical protein